MTRATMNIEDAAALVGIARNTAYELARRTGEIAGVPVIRLGSRRLVIPRAPLLKALGIEDTEPKDAA